MDSLISRLYFIFQYIYLKHFSQTYSNQIDTIQIVSEEEQKSEQIKSHDFQYFQVIRAPKLRTHSNACLVNLAVKILMIMLIIMKMTVMIMLMPRIKMITIMMIMITILLMKMIRMITKMKITI